MQYYKFSSSRIELAVWTHSVANDIKPELLQDMPEHDTVGTNGTNKTHTTIESITGPNTEQSDESNLDAAPAVEPVGVVEAEGQKPQKAANGKYSKQHFLKGKSITPCGIVYSRPIGAVDSLDESTLSEDSLEPNTPIIVNEETNDSDSHSSAKRYV